MAGEKKPAASRYMRSLAAAWPDRQIMQALLAQLPCCHQIVRRLIATLLRRQAGAANLDAAIAANLKEIGYGE